MAPSMQGTMPLDVDERIAAVRAIFRCDDQTARRLNAALVHQHVTAKQAIAHQGDPSNHCWLVIDGAVRVHALGIDGQRQQLAQHGPGEMFGAYPEPTVHRAEIIAQKEAHLLRGEARVLSALAAEHAQIGAAFAILLARQLDRALDRMVARTTFSATGRVYAQLLQLAGDSLRIAPPPLVTALALSANTSRETASRALAALIRRGIVRRDDHELVIAAPRMLQELIC